MVTRFKEDRSDSAVESVLLEGEQEFPLDPHGRHRVRSQYHDKPVATLQCRPDLVVPLLRALNVGLAVPDRDALSPEHIGKLCRKLPVGA